MSEKEVFWLGGKPGAPARDSHLADEPDFVAAIGAACESAGCPMLRLISAKGPYGTWVAEIDRGGQTRRVLWNGKGHVMVLQVPHSGGGWDDALSREVTSEDTEGFVAGVGAILAAMDDG